MMFVSSSSSFVVGLSSLIDNNNIDSNIRHFILLNTLKVHNWGFDDLLTDACIYMGKERSVLEIKRCQIL